MFGKKFCCNIFHFWNYFLKKCITNTKHRWNWMKLNCTRLLRTKVFLLISGIGQISEYFLLLHLSMEIWELRHFLISVNLQNSSFYWNLCTHIYTSKNNIFFTFCNYNEELIKISKLDFTNTYISIHHSSNPICTEPKYKVKYNVSCDWDPISLRFPVLT